MAFTLLKGGTVLYHNEDKSISALRESDVLISGSTISDISKSIDVSSLSDVHVIDCKDKIICPGFIDCHHHPWQSQVKGIHSDDTLVDYFPTGNLISHVYTADDVFWGELAGLVEAVDGGTTTIVDHSHVTRSPEFASAALAATFTSGIRSNFCLTLVPPIKRWDEEAFELESDPVPPWFFDTLDQLRRTIDDEKSGKVRLGLAFDSYGLPDTGILDVFDNARRIGVDLITSHWRRLDASATVSIPDKLHRLELLRKDILFSHGNGSTENELKVLADAGCYIASTPPTESQMGHGEPTFGPRVTGNTKPLVCLGADCNSNNSSTMLHSMQLYLALARSHRNSRLLSKGQFPREIEPKTEEVFNMATIGGARAIGLADTIGSLKRGKQADIVIFDASSSAMVPAVDENPLVAVVRHASPAEIEAVIIDGKIRKINGKLLPAAANTYGWSGSQNVEEAVEDGMLPWELISNQLRQSRLVVQNKAKGCNIEVAKRGVMSVLGLSQSQLDDVFN